jgi:protein-arginine kinase activator protein McsA
MDKKKIKGGIVFFESQDAIVPASEFVIPIKASIDELKIELQHCIDTEKYERAAILRDLIKEQEQLGNCYRITTRFLT